MSAGGANKKDAQNPIVVPDLNALKEVIVAPLDEGTAATVVALNDARYVLHKSGGLAEFLPEIVVPKAGSPSAGAPGAYWQEDFVCGVQESVSSELTGDASATSTTFVAIGPPGVLVQPVTSPAPTGGILLVDFSAVLELNPGTNPDTQLVNPQAETTVALFLDNATTPFALATFNAVNPIVLEQAFNAPIETVAITKRLTGPAGAPLSPGLHVIVAKWKVDVAGATVFCRAGTFGIDDASPRFYMCLRALEVSC